MKTTQGTTRPGFRQSAIGSAIAALFGTNTKISAAGNEICSGKDVNLIDTGAAISNGDGISLASTGNDNIKCAVSSVTYAVSVARMGPHDTAELTEATRMRDFELESDSSQAASTDVQPAQAKSATPAKKTGFDAIIASVNRTGKQMELALASIGFDVVADFTRRSRAKLGTHIQTAVRMTKAAFQVERIDHYTGVSVSAISA